MDLIATDSIHEEGVVTEIHGHMATVRIDKAAACAHCKAGCMDQGGSMITEATNPSGAQVGDTVQLTFDSRAALTASAITFGIPLLALIFGVILGGVIARIVYQEPNQLLSIGTGMTLFFLSFLPLRAYDKRLAKREDYRVIVTEILKSSGT